MQQEFIDQQPHSPTPIVQVSNTDLSAQYDHDFNDNVDNEPDSPEDGSSVPASAPRDAHSRSSRGGKRSPAFKGRRLTSGNQGNGSSTSKWKGKRRAGAAADPDGACYLLALPTDVLRTLLVRLPPRTLATLSLTCHALADELRDDALWRGAYVNRFFYDGASRSEVVKQQIGVLVQGCKVAGGRGWKREALAREKMLDRWTQSKLNMITHQPNVGLIHSLSLAYPPATSITAQPNGATVEPPTLPAEEGDAAASPTPAKPLKTTHRQKYEALLAATTRPAPHVLSASLAVGGIVKSDPIAGKVSKGFWGPGRDANLSIRPGIDPLAEPAAVFLPPRTQHFALWGLLSGATVHSTLISRSSARGLGAASVNVRSSPDDDHVGEVLDVYMPASDFHSERPRWVTAGADGRVKLWELSPAPTKKPASGRRTPGEHTPTPGDIRCLFTSPIARTALAARPEVIHLKQSQRPDEVIAAQYDSAADVVCGVTADGDMRLWFAASTSPQEVRMDVGSEQERGEVRRLELQAEVLSHEVVARVIVLHHGAVHAERYDIRLSGENAEPEVSSHEYVNPGGAALFALETFLESSAAISAPKQLPSALSLDQPTLPTTPTSSDFGRFIVGGDQYGTVSIWPWATSDAAIEPLRSFSASSQRITAIDYSCGLLAVGTCDGHIKVYDPLPDPPILLRSFHATHLAANQLRMAQSQTHQGLYHTINQIILDNDLVVASVGSRVVAWKAGSGKGREGGKKGPRRSIPHESKGARLGLKSIHRDVTESRDDLARPTAPSQRSHAERRELAAMDDLGLADGDEALQYALMLSMEEAGASPSPPRYRDASPLSSSTPTPNSSFEVEEMDEEAEMAVRRVRESVEREERELEQALEMIRLSEGR